MNTAELLSELRVNILRDVHSLDVDPATPEGYAAIQAAYLWTDATLLRYINDAYTQFARKTLVIKDKTTSALCEVTLVAGQTDYPLDAKVLSVMSVHFDGYELSRLGHSTLTGNNPDVAYRQGYSGITTIEGRPRNFTTDETVSSLRVFPKPTAAEAGMLLRLRVARLPLAPLTIPDSPGEPTVPEIPEQYHMDLLEWAAWRALRNHDTDGENLRKASAHRSQFNRAIEEAEKSHALATFTPPQFKFNANWS